MKTELKNAVGDVFLTIEADEENQWLKACWQGSSLEEEIKSGMEAYTQALQRTDFYAILIDTRERKNAWLHLPDWTLEQWAPQAARTSLQHYALVVNPEDFTVATADAFYTQVRGFKAEVFVDLATARAWLRRVRIQSGANSLQRL